METTDETLTAGMKSVSGETKSPSPRVNGECRNGEEMDELSNSSSSENDISDKKRKAEEGGKEAIAIEDDQSRTKKLKIDDQCEEQETTSKENGQMENTVSKDEDKDRELEEPMDNSAPVDEESQDSNVSEKSLKQSLVDVTTNNETTEQVVKVDGTNKSDGLDLSVKKDSGSVSEGEESNAAKINQDNDKENSDAPMDLTVVSKVNGGSDIMSLSDGEDATKPSKINGYTELSTEKIFERRKVVKRLQEELRNEEAKLVLLKKIRQSQLLQQIQDVTTVPSNKPTPSPQANSRAPQAGPPPLIKGGLMAPNHKQTYMGSSQPPQLSRAVPSQHQQVRSQPQPQRSQGPPPLVMAPTARGHQQLSRGHPSQSSHSVQQQQSSRGSSQSGSSQPSAPSQPEQTPAQRQAAAKLALRKQLEKTLLQIPPPKPPPPEMNFIPSLAGNDFMLLVGLEEVVKFIVDIDARAKGEKGPEVKYVFNPFVCVQCGTDFTPVWKRDKPGSKNVICEQCVTSNQKKALKQEHTNRLKSAFVKALQQEQEIEQRMNAQSSSSSSSNRDHSNRERDRDRDREHSREHNREYKEHRERDRDRDRDREHSSRRDVSDSRDSHRSSRESHSAHSSHHSSSSSNPVNLSTNFKPTNEQILQHQKLLQAHQAQLRGAALGLPNFNQRLMYPFSPQHLSSSASKDLQRQYLLDMIPRLPGNNVLWRS